MYKNNWPQNNVYPVNGARQHEYFKEFDEFDIHRLNPEANQRLNR